MVLLSTAPPVKRTMMMPPPTYTAGTLKSIQNSKLIWQILQSHWYSLINYIRNPTIYNIIHWFAGQMGQTNCWPSVSCSNYYYFFFHKITKMKLKTFKKQSWKKDIWNVRRLVDESFVPLTHLNIVLYCRLSDFW